MPGSIRIGEGVEHQPAAGRGGLRVRGAVCQEMYGPFGTEFTASAGKSWILFQAK